MKPKSINIVYYGPGSSGKTENLLYIYETLIAEEKGELVNQCINEYDRLVSFDLVLPEGQLIHLQWLPGAVYFPKSRQDVLIDAHGVVFVADSFTLRLEESKEILAEFVQYLHTQNYSLDTFPWVIQYTKRDMSKDQILSVQELESQLNSHHVPYFEAIPPKGIGVLETFNAILQRVGVKRT